MRVNPAAALALFLGLKIGAFEYRILSVLQPSEATKRALLVSLDALHPYGQKIRKDTLQAALRRLETKGMISSAKEDGQRKIYKIEPSGIEAVNAFSRRILSN